MTKAQEVKKALKGHFNNLKCTNGRGTAWGWVELSFDLPKPKECYCAEQLTGYCLPCSKARDEARKKVYDLIKQAKIELYNYTADDGYNSQNDCMLIDINLISQKPEELTIIYKSGGYEVSKVIIEGYDCQLHKSTECGYMIQVPMGKNEEKKMFDELVYHNQAVYHADTAEKAISQVKEWIINYKKNI